MKRKDKDAKRELTVPELQAELLATREKQFRLRFKHRVTPLTDTAELKDLRRHIARLQTWIQEKAERAA